MKNRIFSLLLLFVSLLVQINWNAFLAQTTIFSEAGGGAFPAGWSGVNNGTGNIIDKGRYYLVDAGNPSDVITTLSYDLSAYGSAAFLFNITSYGNGTHRSAIVEVSYDGGTTFTQTYTSPVTNSSYVTHSFSLSSVSSQVVLRISHNATSGRGIRLRNLILEATPPVGPTLVATPTSLAGLDYNLGSGPSAVQTFELTGSNLNGTDAIELLTGTEFEISSDNISFSDYIDLGLLTSVSQTIYVRLKAGLIVGNYNDMILIAGGGVPSANEPIVSLSGEVYEAYDIIFNANGGTGTMPNQTINSGITENLSSNTFTRTGYVFAGWAATASGAVVYADNDAYTMGSSDVTLYAQWDVYVGPCVEEDFSNIGSSSGYGTRTWSGFGGVWTATDAREDQTINGKAITFKGKVTSPTFTGGIGDLTITTKYPFSDGSGTLTIKVNGTIVGSVAVTTSTQTFTISNIDISGSVIVEIENDQSSNRPSIDDLSWTCYIPTCTPTASITSFLPNSGPAGTIITITGSGFTGATDVKFGTVDATSFTIVDDNTITAEVPAGIGDSETISVFDASACEEVSVDTYSLTTSSGTCSAYPGYTDLFMSEVYDHSPGNGWYLELYNPTSSPVVLTGVYQIERYGELNLTGSHNLIDLVGTVPPMSVFVIQLHSYVTCSGLSVDFQTPGDWGINANDRIRLVKNGTVVDDVSTPNNTGYTIVRDINPSGVAPSDVYPTVGWTTGSNDCSDLGFFTLPPATNIDVTSPTDVSGCSLNMSVTSTTPGVTYSWKFNDPTTNTWLAVNSTNLPGVTITGETTSNLSITRDLAFMEDFQFYCEVSESGCSSASDAAQFNTDSRPIYRSVAGSNGVWSDYTNWEMSFDYITYVPACTYPRDINSSEVIIQAGTYIRLDLTGTDDVTIDKVTIENTGTLEIEANAQLTVNNSVAASDFIVNGTLFDRTNATNVMVFVTGATWELGANGTVIKSNESDVDFYRDVYEGGMANIPATADWIYRFNNDGDPTVGTIDYFYPNLSFENTTTTAYSFGGNFNSFNGSTGFATVKGNFDIGVTGSSTCLVSNANFNVQPMLVYGNMHVDNGSGLVNYNTATTEFGTGFELKGDLLVNGTLSVLSGTTERVFRFTGTTDQTVSGAGVIDLFKVTVNKATGNILLNRDLQVQNELVMAQGHIFTNTSLLELGLSTTQKGILNHTNDYVVGRMRRWFDGTNLGDQTGLYPMGYDDGGLKNRNTKIEFTTAPTDGGHLTVEYIDVPMGPAGLTIPAINSGGAGFDVTTTEDQGYWKIDNEIGKLVDGLYTISCIGEGYTTITDLSKLTLLKRVVANSPDWFCPGVHIATVPSTFALPMVARLGVTGWSNFGFGSVYDINPLPVTLTSFEVDCSGDNKQINIRWSTSSESNSSHFVVEKSRDMAQWSTVSQVPAAGNSTHHIDYSELDENPWSGIVYYRLRQFDFNGDAEVFNAISASCSMEGSKTLIYPNPSDGDFTVEVTWSGGTKATQLQIVDVTGRIVGLQDVILKEGTMQFYFNQIDLKPGIYRVVFPNTELKPLRVLVAH